MQLGVKVIAEGPEFSRFFTNDDGRWNTFDLIIVMLSLVEYIYPLGPVTVLRMLRFLRVVRLLHSSPTLRSVTQSLLNAFMSVGCE